MEKEGKLGRIRRNIRAGLTGILLATAPSQTQAQEFRKATKQEVEDVRIRIKDKCGFTPKPKEIAVEKTELTPGKTSYFVTFPSLKDSEVNSKLGGANALTKEDSAMYFPQSITTGIDGLWEVVTYDLEKDHSKVKERPALEQYVRLTQKQLGKSKSKEEFYKFNKDPEEKASWIRLIAAHESDHQTFWSNKRKEIDDETLVYALSVLDGTNDFLNFALIVRSRNDLTLPSGSATARITDEAGEKILKFYDEKMAKAGKVKGDYNSLTLKEIRNYSEHFLQKDFPEEYKLWKNSNN